MVTNIRVPLVVVFILVVSLWFLVPTKYPLEELYSKEDYFEDMSVVYYDLGTLCMKRKAYAKAIKHFKTSIDYLPNNLKVYKQLLHCYKILGKTEKAVALELKIEELKNSLNHDSFQKRQGVPHETT